MFSFRFFFSLVLLFGLSFTSHSDLTSLTPTGAEKEGNSSGTIPPWTGGITTPPTDYTPGEHHTDPYPNDLPLFTIDASNVDQYRSQLSLGHQQLLKNYSTLRLHIYPTRRSFSAPQHIYDAVQKNGENARLVDGGEGVTGATMSSPFPQPQNGLEVMWNHLLRYRGEKTYYSSGRAAVTQGGQYTLATMEASILFPYSFPDMTEEDMNNKMVLFKYHVRAPAKNAGEILLVHETLNKAKNKRSAWKYYPSLRRVKRSPEVAYDNPAMESDGLATSDQFDMFNGAMDRYDWKLLGKKGNVRAL